MEAIEFDMEWVEEDGGITDITIKHEEPGRFQVAWGRDILVDVEPDDFTDEERGMIEERARWERRWWGFHEKRWEEA